MQHLHKVASTAGNVVGEVPPQRWRLDDAQPEQVSARHSSWAQAARHLAWVREIELFDGLSFGVSRAEAAAMDPQQRLLLETTHVAIHSAGCFVTHALEGSGSAVFLGISNADFSSFLVGSDSVYAGERRPAPNTCTLRPVICWPCPKRLIDAPHPCCSHWRCHLGRRRENLVHSRAAGAVR